MLLTCKLTKKPQKRVKFREKNVNNRFLTETKGYFLEYLEYLIFIKDVA